MLQARNLVWLRTNRPACTLVMQKKMSINASVRTWRRVAMCASALLCSSAVISLLAELWDSKNIFRTLIYHRIGERFRKCTSEGYGSWRAETEWHSGWHELLFKLLSQRLRGVFSLTASGRLMPRATWTCYFSCRKTYDRTSKNWS